MMQQWIDLARYTGLQTRKSESPSFQISDSPSHAALECNNSEEANIDEIKNQWGANSVLYSYPIVFFFFKSSRRDMEKKKKKKRIFLYILFKLDLYNIQCHPSNFD